MNDTDKGFIMGVLILLSYGRGLNNLFKTVASVSGPGPKNGRPRTRYRKMDLKWGGQELTGTKVSLSWPPTLMMWVSYRRSWDSSSIELNMYLTQEIERLNVWQELLAITAPHQQGEPANEQQHTIAASRAQSPELTLQA